MWTEPQAAEPSEELLDVLLLDVLLEEVEESPDVVLVAALFAGSLVEESLVAEEVGDVDFLLESRESVL